MKSWWEIYPSGTKEGDEEVKFFIALARNPERKWRNISKLTEETNLSRERVEEIIAKYASLGIVYQNPKDPEQWGYWERTGVKKTDKDILDEDHESRLNKKS